MFAACLLREKPLLKKGYPSGVPRSAFVTSRGDQLTRTQTQGDARRQHLRGHRADLGVKPGMLPASFICKNLLGGAESGWGPRSQPFAGGKTAVRAHLESAPGTARRGVGGGEGGVTTLLEVLHFWTKTQGTK